MVNLYFQIDKKIFDKIKPRLEQASIDSDPNDKDTENRMLIDLDFEEDEIYMEEGKDTIFLNGTATMFGYQLGYISITLPVSSELATEAIDRYMKKLGKLKTVLEASK